MILPDPAEALSNICMGFAAVVVTRTRQRRPGVALITVSAEPLTAIAVVLLPPEPVRRSEVFASDPWVSNSCGVAVVVAIIGSYFAFLAGFSSWVGSATFSAFSSLAGAF